MGVPSVRLNSERMASQYQGKLIRINPTDSSLSTHQFQYSYQTAARTASGISLQTTGLKAIQKLDKLMEKE